MDHQGAGEHVETNWKGFYLLDLGDEVLDVGTAKERQILAIVERDELVRLLGLLESDHDLAGSLSSSAENLQISGRQRCFRRAQARLRRICRNAAP
jgi:hypothetical protein